MPSCLDSEVLFTKTITPSISFVVSSFLVTEEVYDVKC